MPVGEKRPDGHSLFCAHAGPACNLIQRPGTAKAEAGFRIYRTYQYARGFDGCRVHERNVVVSKGHDKSGEDGNRTDLLCRAQCIARLSANFCHAKSGKAQKQNCRQHKRVDEREKPSRW